MNCFASYVTGFQILWKCSARYFLIDFDFLTNCVALIKSLVTVSLLSAAPRQDTVIEMEDAQPLLAAQVMLEI